MPKIKTGGRGPGAGYRKQLTVYSKITGFRVSETGGSKQSVYSFQLTATN